MRVNIREEMYVQAVLESREVMQQSSMPENQLGEKGKSNALLNFLRKANGKKTVRLD